MSWTHAPTADSAAASIAVVGVNTRYRNSANPTSAPRPCSAPDASVSRPHCEPSSADTLAATSSAKSAAPGFLTMSPARTAGRSHTPYRMFCAGGSTANAGVAADQTKFHAQNTTPNATAIAAVTTMSTVLQVKSDLMTSLLRDLDDEEHAFVEGYVCRC